MSDLSIEWTTSTFPLGNRTVLWQLLIAFGVPVLVLGLFIAIIAKENRWLIALQIMSFVAAILMVLLVLAVLILWLVGYKQHFVLDRKGVRSANYGRTKIFFRVAQIVGILSGRPGTMGAALSVRLSDEIGWQEVRKVEAEDRRHLLILHRESGAPFLLFCTAENFATVREVVRSQTGVHGEY